MPLPDLDDAEEAALIDLLRQTIAADRFPLSPRIRTLRVILARLEPPKQAVKPLPPPKPPGEPSWVRRKKRR
jgi:hypothetical protein